MDKLTRNDILNMEAGREMDALIAERVMGWKRRRKGDLVDFGKGILHHGKLVLIEDDFVSPLGFAEQAPHYSTSIAEAWNVVKKIVPVKEDETWMEFHLDWEPGEYCYACFTRREHDYRHGGSNPIAEFVGESTGNPAMGICRAALIAILDPQS